MKTNPPALIIALLGLLLMPFSSTVYAQDPKPRDPDTLNTNGRLKQMAGFLALTDEQKEKVRPVILEEVRGVRLLREDEKISGKDRMAKEEELRAAYKSKLKTVLTSEQFQKWEEMNKRASKKPKK